MRGHIRANLGDSCDGNDDENNEVNELVSGSKAYI